MTVILDQKQIENAIGEITSRIVAELPSGTAVAAIGIRSRGEILAQRLAAELAEKLDREVPCGILQA